MGSPCGGFCSLYLCAGNPACPAIRNGSSGEPGSSRRKLVRPQPVPPFLLIGGGIVQNNTPVYSVAIPVHILKDASISATAKLLYGIIDSFQKRSGVCFASNERLAEELGGCTPRTASKCLGELRTAGYIITDDIKGRKIYLATSISGGQGGGSFLPPSTKETSTQVEESFQGGGRNFPPSKSISNQEKKNKRKESEPKPEQLTDDELRPLVVASIQEIAEPEWTAATKNELFRWVMALYDPNRKVRKAHPVRSELSVKGTFRKLAMSGKNPNVMIGMLCSAIEGGWQGVQVPESGTAAKPKQEEVEYRCL